MPGTELLRSATGATTATSLMGIPDSVSLVANWATFSLTPEQMEEVVKRALPENELQALAQQVGLQGQSYPNVKAAVEAAKQHSSEKDFIFVGGSSFIVADLLKFHV